MNKTCNKLGNLLLETNETYYWIGFLLADGYFSESNRLKITLSSLDREHIFSFGKYVECNTVRSDFRNDHDVVREYVTINVMDKNIISSIKEKFNINNKKTYSPPKIEIFRNMDKDKLLSLIVGFIDGDGCIKTKSKSFSLTVKCHSSWLSILDFFSKIINPTSNGKLNAKGYAYFTICNVDSLKKLKKFAIDNKLPILSRKWDLINLNYLKNKEAHERNFETFVKLFNKFKNMEYFSEKFNKLVYVQ